MSGIRSRDTAPERAIRRGLHARGFRFRLNPQRLPGRPDLVLTRHRVVVFVHGCFWHRHRCHLFRWPATRVDFWSEKLAGNADRDRRNVARLRAEGWSVATVWECSLRGKTTLQQERLLQQLERWIRTRRTSPEEGVFGATGRVPKT